MTDEVRDYLVSTSWLHSHLGDPNLRIFDCTGITNGRFVNTGRADHYDKHHIQGAAYLDMADPKGPMTDPGGPFPFTWPTQAQFEATMSQIGVGNDSRVVLYAAANSLVPGSGLTWATRAWWLMHHFGVYCAVLDGGWRKWAAEERPVSVEPHVYPAAEFKAKPGWDRGLARKEDVLAALDDNRALVVDSLSPESYRGEIDRNYSTFGPRRGHISGAVNVHYQSLTDPASGCFLSPESLRQRFEAQGLTPRKHVITYCGGGIGATVDGLALKLIGHDDVSIYDASLMEWANDPSLPMTSLVEG